MRRYVAPQVDRVHAVDADKQDVLRAAFALATTVVALVCRTTAMSAIRSHEV